jgi:hypothetical protein
MCRRCVWQATEEVPDSCRQAYAQIFLVFARGRHRAESRRQRRSRTLPIVVTRRGPIIFTVAANLFNIAKGEKT